MDEAYEVKCSECRCVIGLADENSMKYEDIVDIRCNHCGRKPLCKW